jgi:hypothetical protein
MPLAATSQGMPPLPATPVPGEAPVGILAEFDVPELPTPHAEVWFIRMQLDPDGSVAMGKQAGPSIFYVESGELTIIADAPVTMGAVAATPSDATPTAGQAKEAILAAESSVLVQANTIIEFRNDGDESVSVLGLLMFSAEMEGADQQEYPEPVGLKQGGVAIGSAEFMPVPASITIERIVLEPGTTVEPEKNASEMDFPGYMDMELGAIETGSAEVTLDSGSMANLMWPGMLENPMSRPQMVPMTATVQINTGDAYSFNGSTLTWAVTSNEPLTVLRVVIRPAMGDMGR